MVRKAILVWLIALALVPFHFAEAQQLKKIARIGLLFQSSPSFTSPQIDALRQELRELGYVEGRNVSFERRYAEGELNRLLLLLVN
jgi:putative tryptophan/tyrosine transport system substrate-binding protein